MVKKEKYKSGRELKIYSIKNKFDDPMKKR